MNILINNGIMTKIIGLQGKFNGNIFNSSLKSLEYNNELNKKRKFKGIFLSSEDSTIFNNNFSNFSLFENEDDYYNIGFGAIGIRNNNYLQPIKYKDLILIFEGVIYNNEEINSILGNSNDIDEFNPILILKLLYKFYSKSMDLKKSVEKVRDLINGDYVFAVFDGNNLAITRDNVGIKPLYYNIKHDYNINKDYNSFACEKKALWRIGIDNNEINSLKPGYILYNWEEFPPKANPWDHDFCNKNIYKRNDIYDEINIGSNFLNVKDMDYDQIKSNLLKLIENSTYNRIKGLDQLGLIFSGGLDSTILATLLKKYKENCETEVTLYTVGDKNSKDLKYSQIVAKQLNLPIKTKIIDETIVRDTLPHVIKAIEETNLMKIGVGMTLYLATKLASDDDVPVVLTGLGADELFAGYNRYLAKLKSDGEEGLQNELVNDIKNNYDVNLERDVKVANANGVQLRFPYLDEKLINFSLNIPIKYKINLADESNYNIEINNNINNNHNINNVKIYNEDNLRKKILRDVAIDIGVDEEIAMRPKKAAQYGSGINKILKKKVLKDTDINKILTDIMKTYNG